MLGRERCPVPPVAGFRSRISVACWYGLRRDLLTSRSPRSRFYRSAGRD